MKTKFLVLASLVLGLPPAFAGVISGGGTTSAYSAPQAKFAYHCQINVNEAQDCSYYKAFDLTNDDFLVETAQGKQPSGSTFITWDVQNDSWDYMAPGCKTTARQFEVIRWRMGFLPQDKLSKHAAIQTNLTADCVSLPSPILEAHSGGATLYPFTETQASLFWYGPQHESESAQVGISCEQKLWQPIP